MNTEQFSTDAIIEAFSIEAWDDETAVLNKLYIALETGDALLAGNTLLGAAEQYLRNVEDYQRRRA